MLVGSDDAIPPYIPHEYLGTRREELNKHPTGIYGVNGKQEDQSTIDEKLVTVSVDVRFLSCIW